MRSRSIIIVASIILGALSSGCAAQPGESSEDENANGASAASSDPRVSIKKDAQSILLHTADTDQGIGAPAKIKHALASMDGGGLLALPGAPRCGPPRLSLTINDAENKKLASVSVCGTDDTAFLQFKTDWFQVPFKEGTVREVFAEKAAVGDMLYAATEVAIRNPSGTGQRQPAAQYKKGFDLDSKPAKREANETPRCAPLMTLQFTKGSTDVASVAVFCPKNDNDTKAPATITVRGQLIGWVTYDLAGVLGSF
jgi:hypothetical protein